MHQPTDNDNCAYLMTTTVASPVVSRQAHAAKFGGTGAIWSEKVKLWGFMWNKLHNWGWIMVVGCGYYVQLEC